MHDVQKKKAGHHQKKHPAPQSLKLPERFEANGCVWKEDRPTKPLNNIKPNHKWHFDSPNGERLRHECHYGIEGDVLDYFATVFPTNYLTTIVHLTNKELRKDKERKWATPLTVKELLRFFGVVLVIPRLPDMERRKLWSVKPMSKYTVAADLGRTGMTRYRFEAILCNIRFSDQPEHQNSFTSDAAHRWKLVDDFVKAINIHRGENFNPGWGICIDESMIRWYGMGGSWISEGLPHYSMIDRKPDNGCEIRDSCCAVTGIMCQIQVKFF